MTGITKEQAAYLEQFDTPTICNSIELVQGGRGFNAFTRGQIFQLIPGGKAICGMALTAKISGEEPPAEPVEVIKERRLNYYKHMANGPRPAITVVEDMDPEPVAAYWGEVNTNIHRGFGIAGVLTNGVIRDFGVCPEDFPVFGGSVGPSHRFVHVRDVGTSVKVFGMTVNNGDIIHADRHGAVVIPPEVLDDLPKAIEKMMAIEAIVIEPSKQPDFNYEKFAEAWAEVERRRV